MKGFASDNYAPAHPEVLAAIAEANTGHATPYGADPWTARAEALFREHFGEQASTHLVFNGTGANVLCFRALCRPWESVVCAASAHVNVDEGGATERIAGIKLHALPTLDGKLAEDRDLLLHVDGSRLANAAAGIDVPLRAIATDAGVHALSFGGTKNGLLVGEAVVMLRPGIGDGMAYLRKQTLQLASKGRFLAAQFIALLDGDLWHRSAAHANAMAARLEQAVRDAPGVRITQAVQANGVFAVLPPAATEALQRDWHFYTWDEATGEVRWMCSWDTTSDEVDAFAAAVRAACAEALEPKAG